MKKRILTVLLSAAIAVSALCGCEESQETGGRARTKEEQREESTREDSRENSEDSGETSSGESGQDSEKGKGGSFLEGLFGESKSEKVWVCTKITEMSYKSDGSEYVEGWIEREYDDSGSLIKETTGYNDDGIYDVYQWYEYEYDDAGNMTKITGGYGSDGSIDGWNEYV